MVAHTRPPDGYRLDQIRLPLDAMLFVLPLDFSIRTFGWSIPFISVVRAPKGNYPEDIGYRPESDFPFTLKIENVRERIIWHYPVFNKIDVPVDYTGAYPIHLSLTEIAQSSFVDATLLEDEVFETNLWERTLRVSPLGDDETKMCRKIEVFIITLLSFLSVRPNISKGEIARKQRIKHGKIRDESWNPSFIGRGTKINGGAALGGTHASPRPHWRWGHWTHQVKGRRDQNFVSASSLPRNDRGEIDWSKVEESVRIQFWKNHELILIEPQIIGE